MICFDTFEQMSVSNVVSPNMVTSSVPASHTDAPAPAVKEAAFDQLPLTVIDWLSSRSR